MTTRLSPSHWSVRTRRLFWTGLIILAIGIPTILSNGLRFGQLPKATLYFLPLPETLLTGQEFSVELRVQTSGSINAVGTVLHYDQKQLDLIQMNTDQSFCSFYTENSFDTIQGEVHLSCGSPYPGFSGDSVVFRLTMRPRTSGTSTITLDPKQTLVLANNGRGSNVVGSLPHLTLTVPQTY